jgi:hypothetical protein
VFITPQHDNGIASVKLSGNGPNAYAEFLFLPPALKDLPPGYITTVMGIGTFFGDGRSATNAMLQAGNGQLALGKDGTIYLSDPNSILIRRVRTDGVIERVAAGSATLSRPDGLEMDANANLLSGGAHAVRRIDAQTGAITIIAGSDAPGFSGDGGPALNALFHSINRLAFDGLGNLYLLDWGNVRIRRIDVKGIVTPAAGSSVFLETAVPQHKRHSISGIRIMVGSLLINKATSILPIT